MENKLNRVLDMLVRIEENQQRVLEALRCAYKITKPELTEYVQIGSSGINGEPSEK